MRYRRLIVPGGCYFFTINLKNRKSSLLIDEIDKLKKSIRLVKNRHPFTIDAMVVLPDHLHMVITLPYDDSNFSKRISLIKNYFSRSINKYESTADSRQLKRERNIWQRRFWEHLIRNEKDFIKHVDYIHYNPVKHGHAKNPHNWKYSSVHQFVRLGLLPSNWSGE